MFVENRNDAREFFYQVWDKTCFKQPLEPIEMIISGIILEHPEYHIYLEDRESFIESDFSVDQGQTNPFLHMGMHIALKEQINTNRPKGISTIFNTILTKSGSIHDAEHKMMECLGRSLWVAQRNNTLPDEAEYLDCLRRINK